MCLAFLQIINSDHGHQVVKGFDSDSVECEYTIFSEEGQLISLLHLVTALSFINASIPSSWASVFLLLLVRSCFLVCIRQISVD